MPNLKIRRLLQPLRQFAATLFKEHLDARHAAAAVFLGILIGVVPIYGFQTLAVIGLATLFRLNKPLAFAATFVNNPLLQPFLIVGSIVMGHFMRTGRLLTFSLHRPVSELKSQFGEWLLGSLGLGMLLGSVGALATFLLLRLRSRGTARRRECARFVNSLFAHCSYFDRGFVRWKMRLDRCFDFLSTEELGSGPVVDLGCGYGIALGFAAFGNPQRQLMGCDLDARRIAAARRAFSSMNAEFAVCDVRNFDLPRADLIFIFDVLQYLTGPEQLTLLERCSSALAPGGKLIFRVPDRGAGATSRLSLVFDRLIFFLAGRRAAPVVLSAEEYRGAFVGADLQIAQRRVRNRLPLAHLLFIVAKLQTPVNAK
jgi:SAM-dependent methyltransferase